MCCGVSRIIMGVDILRILDIYRTEHKRVRDMKFDYISDFHVEMNICAAPSFGLLWGVKPKVGEWWQIAENSLLTQGIFPFFYDWEKHRQANVLVMAGDAANDPRLTVQILNEAARFYKRVLFVDGNHEHYISLRKAYQKRKQDVFVNMEYIRNNISSNITYLGTDSIYIQDDVMFIGANGWYDFKAGIRYGNTMTRDESFYAWKAGSNDSRILFPPDGMPDALAEQQVSGLVDIVNSVQDDPTINKIVVVTHTIPIKQMCDVSLPSSWLELNGSYVNTGMSRLLDADVNDKIKLWVYGHTHFHDDREYAGVRFVNHARGYQQEKTNWDGPLLLEV